MSDINPYVVASIAGNFSIESTVNPGIWESLIPSTFDHEYQYDGIGGYGLGQWTNVGTQHGRLWNMYRFLRNNGYVATDGNGQMAFITYENYWTQNYGSIASLNEFMTSKSTDLAMLTMSWLRNWEGIGTESYEDRYSNAVEFLSYINDHKEDNPADYSWIYGNRFLSMNEMKNNTMCLYFYLTGYRPTPQPVPEDLLRLLLLFIKKKRRRY